VDNTYGIQLRHPLPGDLIGNRITIAAIGTAFEASYGWRLVNGQNVLAEGFFQAGSMGLMEAFVHETAVSFSHLGPATLQLYGDDPSGQHSPGLDLTEIPVVLVPDMIGYQLHLVTAGETLTRIAKELGSTVDSIAVANRLPDPDLIRIGQILRIPIM
jgi:nucleoid-associated protein YgaU